MSSSCGSNSNSVITGCGYGTAIVERLHLKQVEQEDSKWEQIICLFRGSTFVEIIEIWKEMTEMNTISAYLTDWSTP